MTNPWLLHVKTVHEKEGGSYKDALKRAKLTYHKKQSGKGPYAAEAQAAAQAVGVAGDVSKSAIDAVQTDKANSGRYDKAKFDKMTREFGRLKKKMEKGKFPIMTDNELLVYIEANYGK